ncbi:MAG: energy-coupling factor transporter ATPase [Candidatus Korarchaeota archaeon]|nr:energy-coupling factor transporter ATPase [Thermoproteota archaeon]
MKNNVIVEDLWFRYEIAKDFTLRDIDFVAKPGEFILLIGPSGCGKTTLINTINGIIPHVLKGILKGEVIVSDGEKEYVVKETPMKTLSTVVGTVFQDPETQFFTLSVLTELAFGPENLMLSHDEIIRRINFAAKATGIENLTHKNVFDLSGGQKQRVAIASALAMMPKILILDEPTANLDPRGAKEVLSVIDRLVRELNITVLLIEHRLEEVTKYADKVVVMNKGEILAEGSPKKVFGDPQIIDLLYNIGIRPPWHIEILHKVAQRRNVRIDEIPLTIERAAEILSKILPNCNNVKLERFQELETNYRNLHRGRKVIEIRNLWYVYPDGTVALKGINLDIYEGEFVGIIGQNGSGKSTLCLTILGLYKPSHGYVKVLGKDVSKMSLAEASRSVGMIFQNPDLMLFQNTVWDEIAFGPRNIGLSAKEVSDRVNEALRMMGLTEYKNWIPRALSRGQRHRVAVASILSMRPKILIADEPTTGQDYGSCKEYLELLKQLNENQKMTIIIVSHSMDIIGKYAKRIIVLKDGRIIADGPTHKIFENKKVLMETDLEQPRITQIVEELRKYGFQYPLTLTAEEFLSIIDTSG